VFVGNRAEGGGYEGWGGAVVGSIELSYCTLIDNFSATEGGGAHGATLNGCIVTGNQPDQLAGGAAAAFSNVEGGAAGTGNIDANPLFIDAPNGDYHLAQGSPCIAAGDPASGPDLDGSRADIGAFQFADCNGNGVLDADDIGAGTSTDLNANGFPDECECLFTRYCESSVHSAGASATMGFAGTASVAQNDLVLLARDCPPNRAGLFFYGTAQVSVPFGDGWRCAGGQTFRLGLVYTSARGSAAYALDQDQPPLPAAQITSDSRWNFQFWFRDPAGAGGTGFNLTDGLQVVFCP